MKVAVVGCGAVGSFYGARLWRAGHEVHFLPRGDRDVVRRDGVRVESPEGSFTARPFCADSPREIGRVELALVAVKTTANHALPGLVGPLVGPETAVLTLQNGLGNEEALTAAARPDQILGGLCFVCLNRSAPGVVRHIAHGKIDLGEHAGAPRARTRAIAEMFAAAGIECGVRENLARARWEKLVWNIAFNGLSVGAAAGVGALDGAGTAGAELEPCRTTDLLIGDDGWLERVRGLMGEVVAGANAQGLGIDAGFGEKLIGMTRVMGAYHPSTLLDFLEKRPLELEAIFREPLRRARSAGVEMPRLARLCRALEALDGHAGSRRVAVRG